MKKFLSKFFVWTTLIVILFSAMIFAAPVQAQAATKHENTKAPETDLTTKPKEPEDNGWFTAVTLIKLKSKDESKTYFQWNSTAGAWQVYDEAFRALQGENTLYYYSVNHRGVKETVQKVTIKVDYQKPQTADLTAVSVNGQAKLSWQVSADKNKTVIYRRDNNKYQLLATVFDNSYLDQDVEVNQSYTYQVRIIDQAGLKSKKAKVTVAITKPIVPSPQVIKPAIGKGISTVAPQKVAIPDGKGGSVAIGDGDKPAGGDNPKNPTKNWNRLFIALSILIIAAGAAIAGYYGYEWWMNRRETSEEVKDKKTSNRW